MNPKGFYTEHTPPKKAILTCYHCNQPSWHKCDNCPDRCSKISSKPEPSTGTMKFAAFGIHTDLRRACYLTQAVSIVVTTSTPLIRKSVVKQVIIVHHLFPKYHHDQSVRERPPILSSMPALIDPNFSELSANLKRTSYSLLYSYLKRKTTPITTWLLLFSYTMQFKARPTYSSEAIWAQLQKARKKISQCKWPILQTPSN